jgi:hypothetical protein
MTHETKKPWNNKTLLRSFAGSDTIHCNYGQSDQDIWVLSMLDGLCNGTYLEIGAGWPEHISNTALLELDFGWHGVSLDYQDVYPDMWLAAGRKSFVKGNGQTVDFNMLLADMPPVIDYLSVDCDPGWRSFEILQRIPWEQYKFRLITFEHDCHAEGPAIKNVSREFLWSQGYQLVANNISENGIAIDYEDWWAHPDLVDAARLQLHHAVDDSVKYYQNYLYTLPTYNV